MAGSQRRDSWILERKRLEKTGRKSRGTLVLFLCLIVLLLEVPAGPGGSTAQDAGTEQGGPQSGAGTAGAGYADPAPAGRSSRHLDRRYDAIVVRGETLGAMQGESASKLVLFSFREGGFTAVPFQVDERGPDGEFVFPSGPLAGEDEDRGLLDYNDELVFLVRDAGSRAPEGPAGTLKGVEKWAEIRLRDPLALDREAWVYLCSFSGAPPPRSSADYIRYLPDSEQVLSAHYMLGYRKGMSLYTDLRYPDGRGGYGPDLMDRIKVRIQVKFLFNILRKKVTEDDFRADVVAWKDGPVRVLRNVQNYVRVLFNLSSASVFSVSEYYPWYMFTPLRITIPFDLKWVFNKFGISDWYWYFYGDLPGLEGGTMYTNRNREGLPLTTEHPMKWYEERFDTKYLIWGYATREGVGTWFCNLIIPDSTYQFIQCYLHIDKNKNDPPEDVPGDLSGGALMNFKDVDRGLWEFMAPGTYGVGLETFFAPGGLRPEGVPEWRNIRGFPVLTEVTRGSHTGAEKPGLRVSPAPGVGVDPGLCRRGTPLVMTGIGGRKITLYDVRMHIGTMRATGWDYVIGQDLKTGEWYRIHLHDMKSMEHRLGPPDPVTGMEHPMVAEVIRKDGTVVDMMACGSCTLSGFLADGRKQGYTGSEVKTIEILDPEEICPP
jgi:hypothetical protein